MKKILKIPLTEIAERLGKAMNYTIGMNHMAVLIHGWQKHRPDEATTFEVLRSRKQRDGFAWLDTDEVQKLSHYAGYDLT